MNKIFSLLLVFLLVGSSYAKIDECNMCIDFVNSSLNDLINIILNSGVIGSCADLCGKLPNNILADGCDLLCDYIGITEFVKLLSEEDPDPIYICELTKICSYNDNANATITDLAINPVNGTVGGTFTIGVAFTVSNTIATGEIAFGIVDPQGNSFGDAVVVVQATPNQYSSSFQFQATPSEQEAFPSGEYELIMQVCEGSCGSPHPHSKLLSQQSTNFTITGSDSSNSGGFSSGSSQSGSQSGAATGTGNSGQVHF
ncbi:hypothetical protein DICPUDRAFT_43294 [Dictyostelium purpureum]|uniref:Saposin B-type domain-containing protein n=1 Tax=Dictyostelium purpureum TaxID=5786 RepID=F1A3X2_DICPU|nr:uncharacterized protein DICPUDRAFT_43294 [Dictyostelium purpureum]EGC29111.1 hypothetical protein DICPUDRAFT_43294 [Dictyostelium purpureum]|eukprot:XP_003294366.1 hypothetical protein DICPUDRAFT_43294 [Dictyostelium purpureum]